MTSAGRVMKARAPSRRQERQARALEAMRQGAVLRHEHRGGAHTWSLSTGEPLTEADGRALAGHASVIGTGDALLPDRTLSQTFGHAAPVKKGPGKDARGVS